MKYKMSFQGLFLAAVVVLAGCRPALPETRRTAYRFPQATG